MKRLFALFFAFLFLINIGKCQVVIYGFTFNSKDKSVVPYASVELYDQSKGTLSNDNGHFELHIDSLPTVIKVSCLGFESKIIPIPDTSFLSISLVPTVIRLKEVQVHYTDVISKLVDKAREKALKTRRNQLTGRAFYRQFNNNDSVCTEVLESFYNICTNNNGIRGWELTQARYGIKDVDTGNRVYVYNQSTLTRFLKVYSDATYGLEITQPVVNTRNERVIYELLNQYNDPVSGQKISELGFHSAKNKHDSTYGKIYIDEDSYDILKVVGTYIDKDNRLIEPSGWEREYMETIKNTRFDYEVRFKKIDDFVVLDYLKTKVSLFTIYKKRKINLVSEGFLYVYEIDPTLRFHDMNPEAHDYESIKKRLMIRYFGLITRS